MSLPQELAVCAIFKNDRDMMPEWTKFHRLAGVQQFWLYDRDSTDDSRALLHRYVDEGAVDVVQWHIPFTPCCQWRGPARTTARWAAFHDMDEFACPRAM